MRKNYDKILRDFTGIGIKHHSFTYWFDRNKRRQSCGPKKFLQTAG